MNIQFERIHKLFFSFSAGFQNLLIFSVDTFHRHDFDGSEISFSIYWRHQQQLITKVDKFSRSRKNNFNFSGISHLFIFSKSR